MPSTKRNPPKDLVTPTEDHYTLSSKLIRLIEDNAHEQLTQHLGHWTLFDYQDSPHPVLKLFISPEGVPAITITKRASGLLKDTGNPALAAQRHPLHYRNWLYNAMQARTTEHLFDWLTQHMKPQAMARAMLYWSNYTSHEKTVATAVQLALHSRLATHRQNGRTTHNHDSGWKKINSIINRKFLHPDTNRIAGIYYPYANTWLQGATGSEPSWLTTYNHVHRNLSTYLTLRRESPKVLQAWTHALAKRQPNRVTSPGEIAHQTKEALNASPAQWRIITKAGLADPHNQLPDPFQSSRLASMALTQANCPSAPAPIQREIYQDLTHHEFFNTANWLRGDPWRAWVHLIATTLRDTLQNPGAYCYQYDQDHKEQLTKFLNSSWQDHYNAQYSQAYKAFEKARDTLKFHVEHDLPWPLSTLENYHKRSETWHADRRNNRQQLKEENLRSQCWESLLETTSTPYGVVAVPVTNALDLADLGREMDNCLSAYVHSAMTGNARIFKLLSTKGKLLSAIELSNHAGYWRIGQNEAPNHGKPCHDALLAGMLIQRLYKQAHQQQLEEVKTA